MLKSLRRRLETWRGRNDPQLKIGDTGFSLTQGKRAQSCDWGEVDAIFAFKLDLVTIDQICLAIQTHNGEIMVHEGMEGYEQLLEAFERHLGLTPDWMLEVMFPAFEENLMQIFSVVKPPAD